MPIKDVRSNSSLHATHLRSFVQRLSLNINESTSYVPLVLYENETRSGLWVYIREHAVHRKRLNTKGELDRTESRTALSHDKNLWLCDKTRLVEITQMHTKTGTGCEWVERGKDVVDG